MKKAVIGILAVSLAALAVFWFFLTLGFLEDYDIAPHSPNAYLVMHPAVRAIAPMNVCHAKSYARYFQECGGTCGEQQDVQWGTTATEDAIRAAYDLPALAAQMGVDETSIQYYTNHPDGTPGCNIVLIRTYDDFATP